MTILLVHSSKTLPKIMAKISTTRNDKEAQVLTYRFCFCRYMCYLIYDFK